MWACIGIAAAVLQTVLMSFAGTCTHVAAFNTMHKIKVRVLEHISRFNLGFFQEHAPGQIKTTLFDDVDEQRMKDISELQRRIGTYSKTREVYAQYRKLTGRKQAKFYEQHTSEIEGCQAAKRYFDSLGLKKLPSMQSLKQEYAILKAENKKRYPEYKQAKAKMIELLTAKNNVERILGVTEKEKNCDRQQDAR